MTTNEEINEGLVIIARYDSKTGIWGTTEKIYAGDYQQIYRNATQADFERLVALNWHTEMGYWFHYVGSNR